MPKPAPHTPINFVKGGASLMWSAACVKALMDCGYHPDDFGDYDHVRKRCKAAKRRVQQQSDFDNAPDPKPPPNPPNPPPTPHDHFLAESQSGHLTQNATQVDSGSRGSGDACATRVDGWDDRSAPCMPHHGSANQHGTQHNLVSVMESEQPYAGNPPPNANDPYPGGQAQLDADSRARTQAALDHREAARDPNAQPQTDAYGAAGQTGYFGTDTPESVASAQATDADTVISPDGDPTGKSPSEIATECIDAFRKEAEAAMKKPWMPAQEGESEDAAYDRYRADLERQRDEAQATAARANSDVAAAQERRDQLQRDLDAHNSTTNPPGIGEMRRASDARNAAHRRSTNPDTIARNDERYDAALTERQRLRDGIAAEDDIIDGGQRAANQAASAQCALDEAERLRNGNPQNNPRVPGVNPYLGTDPATNQPVSQQIQSDIDSRRQTSTTANSSF